ncbi:hypothetical protein T4E_7791 [Trichinella pseudospiralis]|uniref:Uncharacterized protein n=1 Tax=Trichinella pseudospiralis TaxID=6337 RepID=A0A0V0XEN3_TRIPS|nr:hypothetical protein T4E_7791 [Trichinella pseudospiralis]
MSVQKRHINQCWHSNHYYRIRVQHFLRRFALRDVCYSNQFSLAVFTDTSILRVFRLGIVPTDARMSSVQRQCYTVTVVHNYNDNDNEKDDNKTEEQLDETRNNFVKTPHRERRIAQKLSDFVILHELQLPILNFAQDSPAAEYDRCRRLGNTAFYCDRGSKTNISTTKHNTFTRYKHRSIDHRTSFFTCWSSNLGHNRKRYCLAAGNGHILPPDYLVQNLISRLLMKDDEI